MMEPLIWVIVGMGLVTYIPRMLPLVVFDAKKIHPRLRGILKNVPYAALGALIFPGIITVNGDLLFGLVGAATAFTAAYLGANLIYVVLSAIVVLSAYSYLFY
ncbi:MAG TPA: AzlD domain-containing protein [Bacillales bacterium]